MYEWQGSGAQWRLFRANAPPWRWSRTMMAACWREMATAGGTVVVIGSRSGAECGAGSGTPSGSSPGPNEGLNIARHADPLGESSAGAAGSERLADRGRCVVSGSGNAAGEGRQSKRALLVVHSAPERVAPVLVRIASGRRVMSGSKRGRRSGSERQRLTETVVVRLAPAEKKILEEAAARMGISIVRLVRESINGHIREPVLATGERNGPPNIKKSERGSATADSAYAEEVVVPLGQD